MRKTTTYAVTSTMIDTTTGMVVQTSEVQAYSRTSCDSPSSTAPACCR